MSMNEFDESLILGSCGLSKDCENGEGVGQSKTARMVTVWGQAKTVRTVTPILLPGGSCDKRSHAVVEKSKYNAKIQNFSLPLHGNKV